MNTIHHAVDLSVMECCACGTPFAFSEVLRLNLKRTGQPFYCPMGHSQVFAEPLEAKLKETEKRAAQLAKELKQTREDSQFWQGQAEQHAAAEKGAKKDLRTTRAALTRTKKLVAAGVCPCCHRQFPDLHNHMTTQHPDYAVEDATEGATEGATPEK